MDDDEKINGKKKVKGNGGEPRKKPTRTLFIHHKAHMAVDGIEPRTARTRVEGYTTEPPQPQLYYRV